MSEFLMHWLAATPSYAAPLLLACLGLLINERAGVLNLGAEGIMAMGAMSGAIISLTWQLPSLGLVVSIVAGAALALVFGVATIYLRTNQVVTGLIIVALGGGLTGLIGRTYISKPLAGFNPLEFGPLSDLPWIGPILFSQDILTYLALLMTLAVWYVLFRSWWGCVCAPWARTRRQRIPPGSTCSSRVWQRWWWAAVSSARREGIFPLPRAKSGSRA